MRKIAAKFMKLGLEKKGRPMLKHLNDASVNVESAQKEVLNNILTFCQNTVFGQKYNFKTILNSEDVAEKFQKDVPVHGYEDLRPYVERHESGEQNVLFPGKPMFYATTSGTTSLPKRIPITRKYHDECYNGLSNLWLSSMFSENPAFMNGYDISMVGKAVEGYTEDGTSYGSFSGHMNSYMPDFIKKFRVIPFEIHDIDHYPSKYYGIMRMAMEVQIAWIVAANPSTLLELHKYGMSFFEDIIRDIHDGTLKSDLQINVEIRRAITARLKPNPKRAKILQSLWDRGSGTLLPKDYWPNLKVINTWKSGNAGLYLRQAKEWYPETTAIREFGYIATEARAGIVLKNDQDTSILACHLIFFEFVHKSELGSESPKYLLANELDENEEYGIYITTSSGLYRYDMNDIVRVEGFYNSFPMVRFVQKGAGATSLTGEKLYEAQYLEAVKKGCEKYSIGLGFHIGFANMEISGYECFLESDRRLTDGEIIDLSDFVDNELQLGNPEYRAKRGSNRLKKLKIVQLKNGAFNDYKSMRMEKGDREGQFKIVHLQQNDENLALFRTLAVEKSG
ncbi:MAG: GH3 auxin-responsive promoter family protein [Deltaproteobacteria bacterium]|nr:GH3 auxin-responsive promoter family protein [Deltaproteobacteria bacterium]